MTLSITTTTVINNASLTGAETTTDLSECTAIDGTDLVALGFYVQVAFDASATAGAEVIVYGSPDNTRWPSWGEQVIEIPLTAGTTVGVSFTTLPGHRYYKIRVKRLDTSHDVTGIYGFAEPQRLT